MVALRPTSPFCSPGDWQSFARCQLQWESWKLASSRQLGHTLFSLLLLLLLPVVVVFCFSNEPTSTSPWVASRRVASLLALTFDRFATQPLSLAYIMPKQFSSGIRRPEAGRFPWRHIYTYMCICICIQSDTEHFNKLARRASKLHLWLFRISAKWIQLQSLNIAKFFKFGVLFLKINKYILF